jgi:hypothetical protein
MPGAKDRVFAATNVTAYTIEVRTIQLTEMGIFRSPAKNAASYSIEKKENHYERASIAVLESVQPNIGGIQAG